ncbi:MAG: hypothetical protein HQL51_05850 [Magnetococcales bacterium]|nr:hypothetical protein [Magnetococcales bacterium]
MSPLSPLSPVINNEVYNANGETSASPPAADSDTPRPLSPAELSHARRTFEAFHQDHGAALRAAGWDRAALFGGCDPERLETVDSLPGVLAALMAGDVLEAITPWRLIFRDRAGERTAWRRGGGWIGGALLEEVEREEIEERAGILMDNGMDQDEADREARRMVRGDER